jgi:hypothetical protein
MELNYSMAVDLVIKLMGDVERMDKSGKDKKDWVKEELHSLMPDFYADHHILVDAIIDGFVLVATSPEMIQTGKRCSKMCIKLLGC